jgi:hypothetical protein
MSRRSTPKISYQRLATDSGYLSDLVDAARRNDEAAGKLLLSSSDVRSRLDFSTGLRVYEAHYKIENLSWTPSTIPCGTPKLRVPSW